MSADRLRNEFDSRLLYGYRYVTKDEPTLVTTDKRLSRLGPIPRSRLEYVS